MKKIVTNIMISTGITLVVLAVIATIYGAKYIFVSAVFQSFAVNVIIHLGLLLMRRFESNYFILETMLDIGYVIIVLIIFGAIFDWYASTPIPILIVMAVFIYLVGLLLSQYRMQKDIETINKLLNKRKKIKSTRSSEHENHSEI